MKTTRRDFLKISTRSVAVAGVPVASALPTDAVVIPKRKFGRHDDRVSVVGIGGHTLYLSGSQKEANQIVARAVDLGINFFDNAWDYHGGQSETYMGVALEGKRDKVFLMSKFCNYHNSVEVEQSVAGALRNLEESLKRLKTDHLDLWLMHQVSHNDLEDAYRADGGIEAIELAKKQGKIRYGGFSGHWKASLNREMIEKGYEWDATLMPVSSVGAMDSREFETQVMPLCKAKQIAVLGMKGFGGSSRAALHAKTNIEKVLQYSLSYPQLCTQIVGIDKVGYVDQAVTASVVKPFTPEQREAYAAKFNFEPGSAQYLAQHHGGALNEAGGCCVRRDQHNG